MSPKDKPTSKRRPKPKAAKHKPGTSARPCTKCGETRGHQGWCPEIS